VKTQTDAENLDEYEVVIMMLWYVFSLQRGPVEKKKEVITEMARRHMNAEEVKVMDGKENLRATFTPPVRAWTELPRRVNVGAYGSCGDGGVFLYSSFDADMEEGSLHLASNNPLPRTDKPRPHYIR
jgi:hypothetical protein